MKTYVSLTFLTAEGKLYTLKIPNAADNLETADVTGPMDDLITANCIKTNNGDLTAREKAQLIKVSEVSFKF